MRIAIDASTLSEKHRGEASHFVREVFIRLAERCREHQFIFIFNTSIDLPFQLPANAAAATLTPTPKNFLSLKLWYDVKLPGLLKSQKVDVLVTPGIFGSLITGVAHVLLLPDISFVYFPQCIPRHQKLFYKLYSRKLLVNVSAIATVSAHDKKVIAEKFKLAEDKITGIGAGADLNLEPIDWEAREKVKEKYADQYEYFVFTGGVDSTKNLLSLLKAFSLFKVRQRSSMKLLVLGSLNSDTDNILEKLKVYKFRDEVKLLGDLPKDEYLKVVGSAYALVQPSVYEALPSSIIEAMKLEVPIVASNIESVVEVAGEAALYANPNDHVDISEQLKTIFKDEQLRSKLIKQGKLQASKFNWEKTVDKLWQIITGVVTR